MDLSYAIEGMNCPHTALMTGNPEIVSMLPRALTSICISDDQPVSLLDWAETKLMFEELVQGSDLSLLKQIVQLLKLTWSQINYRIGLYDAEGSPPCNNRTFSVVPNRKYMEV